MCLWVIARFLEWAWFAEWCSGNTQGLCVEELGPRACHRWRSCHSGPLLSSWHGVGTLQLGLHTFPQIDKVQGLCAASQGTGLMADQWEADGPGRVCWEQ